MAARKHIGRILEECCARVVQKVEPGVKEGFDSSVPWSLSSSGLSSPFVTDV